MAVVIRVRLHRLAAVRKSNACLWPLPKATKVHRQPETLLPHLPTVNGAKARVEEVGMKQSEKTNPPPQTEADIADTREQDRLPLNNLVDGEPLTGKSGERPSPRSHPGQLEQEISRGEKLDYWVREITAPSRQTLDGMLQIGARILEAEASGLSHEEIRQLQEKRLPFSSSDYSKYRT
jgi:hypothetical protein